MIVYLLNYEATDGGGLEGIFATKAAAFRAMSAKVESENARDYDVRRRHAPDGLLWVHRPRWMETDEGAVVVWTRDGGKTWTSEEEAHEWLTITVEEVQE